MTTRITAGGVPLSSDAHLLRAVAGGDQAALRGLYDQHAAWLYARLLRRCNDPEVVADVLQDTFFAVWNGAGRWRGDVLARHPRQHYRGSPNRLISQVA